MPSIAVLGAGAIGGTIGARLAEVYPETTRFCLRRAFCELEVKTPEREIRLSPKTCRSPDDAEVVDWLLVATKAHQTAGAAVWLQALIGPETRVAVLQNGVEHRERLAAFAQAEMVVPVVVDCPARRLAPGVVEQRAGAQLTVPDSVLGRAFAELFRGTDVSVALTQDFRSAAWRKLCLNVAGGAITALTNQGQGVVHGPGVADLARDLVRECLAVGRAEGADLPESLVEAVVGDLLAAPLEAGTSVLQDLRAGRALEVEARNGAVVRLGTKHGIPTPVNRVCAILLSTFNREISAGD